VSTGGELNPVHSGQNPLHLYAGSPDLRPRVDRAAGEAALILAYPVHPICPIAGSFSPDPELCRQGPAHREDRRQIEPQHQCAGLPRLWRRCSRLIERPGKAALIHPPVLKLSAG